MESSVAAQKGTQAADPSRSSSNSSNGASKERSATATYLVFEAGSEEMKEGDTLTFLGRFIAPDKQQARWKAVDAHPELAKRVQVKEGEKGGVFLLAVAERMASPERTAEEVIETKVRR